MTSSASEQSLASGLSRNSVRIEVRNLTMSYGSFVIQRDLSFAVNRGDIFIIMGESGCGKSTLLRHLVGLNVPGKGQVLYDEVDFWQADPATQKGILTRFGILYQNGGLWSSMTLAENVALPLKEYTSLGTAEIKELVSFKLSLVGLRGFEDFFPSQISGGMRKRAGLDPVSARRLDELMLELRDSLGATLVVVTHELASIFTIGNNSVFLDAETRTLIGNGDPKELRKEGNDPKIVRFLTGGQSGHKPIIRSPQEHSATS